MTDQQTAEMLKETGEEKMLKEIGEENLEFDLDALRQKYREERDRRIRDDGDYQYVAATGSHAHFTEDDPYADPNFKRDPIADEVDAVVIGGGFAGLFAAAALRKAGLKDIRIIEAGGDFGGTWYWNRYPGCQCDIESYTYIPLLEETGFMPTMRYAYAPEIFDQCQRIGHHFDLYKLALFQTRVREMRWDEASQRWLIHTNRNDEIKAQFVIWSTGPLTMPKLPGIPGFDDFKGHIFHTSRWDYNYTGGDNSGGLTGLKGKKVAIIGSASTAVQCVPHLAEGSDHLYVFQRTPVAVYPRGNRPTDPEWVKSLTPGWQTKRMANFNLVITGQPVEVDLVNDCWTEIYRSVPTVVPIGQKTQGVMPEAAALKAEITDHRKMNSVRKRIASIVEDPKDAEVLQPWYQVFCKRPTFHDDYLATFNRDNVTLVDVSSSKGVEKITANGIIANGKEVEVDCIVLATGFEVSSDYRRRVDFEVFGKDGQSIFDYWSEGRRTLHGHSTHGFPNLFIVGVSQNGLSMNFSSMYGTQSDHVAHIISEVRARGAQSVEASKEGEAQWVDTIHTLARRNAAFMAQCTPGYYNNEGKFLERKAGFLNDAYAPGIVEFNKVLAGWREKGDFEGLEFSQ